MKLLKSVKFNDRNCIYLLLGVSGVLNVLLGSFLVFKFSGLLEKVLSLAVIIIGCILLLFFFQYLNRLVFCKISLEHLNQHRL